MGFIQELYNIPTIQVFLEEPMGKHTGYGVGGNAKYFINVYDVASLKKTIFLCGKYRENYKVIGNGTNILVKNGGFNGAIICLKGLDTIFIENNLITAYSGVCLCNLIKFSNANGFYGAEALSGIPACVGGALVMNASAFNISVGDFVCEVCTLEDNQLRKYTNKECMFEYRKSYFLGKNIPIIYSKFQFVPKSDNLQGITINDCESIRKEHQPKGKSCGCVFRNPSGDFAGRLIDLSGLKGQQIGGAKVSEKHANFIITEPNARVLDICKLVNLIKQTVYNKFNILLQEEIEIIGEDR